MTAIAYRDGVFCCDSQVTTDDLVLSREPKLHIVGNLLVSGAGNLNQISRFVDWVRDGRDPEKAPELSENTQCYVISKTEVRSYSDDALLGVVLEDVFVADGCFQFLSGAMAAGAFSIEAVCCACIFDVSCSFPIYSAVFREGDWKINKFTEQAARDQYPNLPWDAVNG